MVRSALRRTQIAGPVTNVDFLGNVLAEPDVEAGQLDTGWVERHLDSLVGSADAAPDQVVGHRGADDPAQKEIRSPATPP